MQVRWITPPTPLFLPLTMKRTQKDWLSCRCLCYTRIKFCEMSLILDAWDSYLEQGRMETFKNVSGMHLSRIKSGCLIPFSIWRRTRWSFHLYMCLIIKHREKSLLRMYMVAEEWNTGKRHQADIISVSWRTEYWACLIHASFITLVKSRCLFLHLFFFYGAKNDLSSTLKPLMWESTHTHQLSVWSPSRVLEKKVQFWLPQQSQCRSQNKFQYG